VREGVAIPLPRECMHIALPPNFSSLVRIQFIQFICNHFFIFLV
jgi:hypothetical protein